jgi:hypothetical protein
MSSKSRSASTQNLRDINSAVRSQARAGRHRSNSGRYLQQVKSRLRALKKGVSRCSKHSKIHPGGSDLRPHSSLSGSTVADDPEVAAAMAAELVVIDRLVDEMHEGGFGWVEGRKPSDVVRLMGENSMLDMSNWQYKASTCL